MRSAVLYSPTQAHGVWMALWDHVKAETFAGNRLEVTLKRAKRSSEQNRRMWAMLGEVSAQVNWHGQKLTSEEWKDVFSASLKRQSVVPGLDGGFVVLGQRTSAMTVAEMSELQELIEAFGAQQGVRFSQEQPA